MDVSLQNVLNLRRQLYNFLGYCLYQKPSLTELKTLQENNFFKELAQIENSEDKEPWPGLEQILSFIEDLSHMSEEDFKHTSEEFIRLFYGYEKVAVPPYESVYVGQEKVMFDESTLQVRSYFKLWGYKLPEGLREPEDHIGLELQFMWLLCEKALGYLEERNEQGLQKALLSQKDFLEEHLLNWIDQFSERLFKNTTNELYRGIALFTPYFLRLDQELLANLTE